MKKILSVKHASTFRFLCWFDLKLNPKLPFRFLSRRENCGCYTKNRLFTVKYQSFLPLGFYTVLGNIQGYLTELSSVLFKKFEMIYENKNSK